MKKTIAILLVLVIGMAGVFATTADLEIKTSISDITYLGVTTSSDTPTWASIGNLTNTNALSVDNTNVSTTPIAYLHVNSNNKDFSVFLKSITPLKSTDV
ncbi:MAG: hypothetical protein WCR13_07540, partial [Sphaerochaeta sp.]